MSLSVPVRHLSLRMCHIVERLKFKRFALLDSKWAYVALQVCLRIAQRFFSFASPVVAEVSTDEALSIL